MKTAVAVRENTDKSLPKAVSEAELTKYILDRNNYNAMRKTFTALENRVKEMEENLIERIEKGAEVRSETFSVAIDRSCTKRIVAWKEVAINLWHKLKKNGTREAEKLVTRTKPTVYPHLVVSLKRPLDATVE